VPRSTFVFLSAIFVFALPAAHAAPFKYPEGKHGKGELRYINGLPVLTVEGSPEEIGTQIGALALKPASKLIDSLKLYVKERGLEKVLPLITRTCKQLYKRFPEPYRTEAEAMAKSSGVELDMIVLGNTVKDLERIAGCAVLTVSADRSLTGGPLVGRNFDMSPLANLHEYSLVIVYRPTGKRAFAVVGFPGLLMSGSAMNDAGLVLGANEIGEAKDESPLFNPRGTPLLVGMRHLMEECDSVAKAEKLVRSVEPASLGSLIAADKKDAAVFEITTKNVEVRRPERGLCVCTNHFCSKRLALSTACDRFVALSKAQDIPKLGLKDVAKKMHQATQGVATMHTMIFEPATLKLHLSLGKGPTSARPLALLELAPLMVSEKGD
jgi:hypothetical protein